jgi:hypothetical protein
MPCWLPKPWFGHLYDWFHCPFLRYNQPSHYQVWHTIPSNHGVVVTIRLSVNSLQPRYSPHLCGVTLVWQGSQK